MGWFEEQISQREDFDERLLQDSFFKAAKVILGNRIASQIGDKWETINQALESILKYYHFKPSEMVGEVDDQQEHIDGVLRTYGIMRRNIELEKGWYKDSYGVLLGYLKEDESPVALIPRKLIGYYYIDNKTRKKIKVTKKTEGLFKREAFCFYKPLPQKKLNIIDLLCYMKCCFNVADSIAVTVTTFTATVIGLLIPKIIKALTGPIFYKGDVGNLIPVAVSLGCFALSGIYLNSIFALLSQRIQTKTSINVQAAMMMRMLTLPTGFFRKYSAGELTKRYQAVDQLCSLLVELFYSAGLSAIMSLLYLVQIFSFEPLLVVPAFITVLISLVITCLSIVIQMKVSRMHMEYDAKQSGMTYAMITGVQKLKLAAAEKRIFSKWLNMYSDKANMLYNPPFFLKINKSLTIGITLFSTVIMYYLAAKSGLSQPNYIGFSAAFGSLMGAYTALNDLSVQSGNIKPMLEMAKPFLETEPESAEDKEIVKKISGRIDLNHVYFRYGENLPYVVNDMSLKVKPGEYVAIVGRTGCGKSTLMRLLLGFEKPDLGAIYYDGKDLQTLDLASLRRKIGSVTQSSGLFLGDIYSNIIISAPELTLEDAWKAADTAGIADDIRGLPMGMHTLISEGQGGFSGGQKQRLMIARAIAPNPKLLLLDEATSALDNKTQKKVSEALDNMGCTRIVIAHRLSTIQNCDRILVLDNGRIVEDGSYEELIDKKGYFAELVKRQQLNKAI